MPSYLRFSTGHLITGFLYVDEKINRQIIKILYVDEKINRQIIKKRIYSFGLKLDAKCEPLIRTLM